LSSEAINAYTALRSFDLVADGIRINCVNPGANATAGAVWPLIFLNSPRASSVTGQRLDVAPLDELRDSAMRHAGE
jgi:NAD(P)-dependent dehydrogenase (short-subunit alcohol dehydrogenase family)